MSNEQNMFETNQKDGSEGKSFPKENPAIVNRKRKKKARTWFNPRE
jgi:hypothetical protein